jgi:tetratricopeptide (TPR) repeat protein
LSIPAAVVGALILSSAAPGQDPEDARVVAEEIQQDALMIRRGQARKAVRSLEEILAEKPDEPAARLLLAEGHFELAAYSAALTDAEKALASATEPEAIELRARCARFLARVLLTLGRAKDAVAVLEKSAPGPGAEDAWALGSALWESGARARAREVLAAGAKTPDEQPWRGLLARGECQRRLGDLGAASKSLVAADEASRTEEGSNEPDVLAALGDVYFEADHEIEAGGQRSARTSSTSSSP